MNKKWSDDQIKSSVENANSLREACKNLGLCGAGSGYSAIVKRIKKLKLNLDHFDVHKKLQLKKLHEDRIIPFDKILIENSPYNNTVLLKKRLLAANLLEEKCYICNLSSSWNNQPLVLQLDHINGIRADNRLENLRILCPNCHSQTPTFTGRNVKKKEESLVPPRSRTETPGEQARVFKTRLSTNSNTGTRRTKIVWPSKEELEKLVWEMSTLQLSKKLGVSDKAIEKRCKRLLIPKPPRGYWNKVYSSKDLLI